MHSIVVDLQNTTTAKVATLLFLFVCVATLGCGGKNDVKELRLREAKSASVGLGTGDSLTISLQRLQGLARLEREAALKEFTNEMNSWGSLRKLSDFQVTGLIKTWPSELQAQDFVARLKGFELGDVESDYLWQCRLMRDISAWVLERPYRDKLFEPWLKSQSSKMAAEEYVQLETAMKLFDWVVRNVALDGDPKEVESFAIDPSSPSTDSQIGYRFLPWQTVLVGRGDCMQRARVFTQLLFQQGISSFVFAVDSSEGSAAKLRRLWSIGVVVGNSIYLFEPRLGLPLPKADVAEVATLREVRDDPNILRRARLPGRYEYGIQADDLASLVVLLDAEPGALGQAAKVIEDNLTGTDRMHLFMDADGLAERLNKIDSRLPVELWAVPPLAQVFNRQVRQAVKDKTPFGIRYQIELGAYLYETLLSDARLAHLQGKLSTSLDQVGAASRYMSSRIDDASLERLAYDPEVQQRLGVIRLLNETPDEYQFRITQLQESFRGTKFDTHCFLGSLQFDLDNIDAAVDWMDERLLAVRGTEKWHNHAIYLLARCAEAKGETENAFLRLKEENLPQEAGNRLRARLWEQRRSAP